MKASTYYFAQLLLLALTLSGCATTGSQSTARSTLDPFEPINRVVFQFNDTLDQVVLQPVAKTYKAVLPSGVRQIITNVFSNIGEIFNIANNLLQGKPVETSESFMRFTINSVFGLGGTMDIATKMGLMPHKQDFGLTLGTWGLPAGPYLVLPILGPSSIRDTAGTVVQLSAEPITYLPDVPIRNTLVGVRLVDGRANLLDAGNLLEEAALDKYSFVRESYLQRRRYLINGDKADEILGYEEIDHSNDENIDMLKQASAQNKIYSAAK